MIPRFSGRHRWLQGASRAGAYLLLFGILLIAFWIRMLGRDSIPPGQFNGRDAYLYYWQAEMIAAQGSLPDRDMHRWLPLGRDLGQTLNLYSYAVAYVHRGLTSFFPAVTLYDVMLITPVACFVLALGVLCLYLYRVYGLVSACIVDILLATLPAVILRSIVGFSDRDSWCFLLGVLALTAYLWKFQLQRTWQRYLFSAASGGFIFLGGISWEGFGVFVGVLLFSEIWQFLISEEDTYRGLGEYVVWLFMFVPMLYLASPAYRAGTGFSTHIAALVLVPPLVFLGLRYFRHLLITVFPFSKRIRPHSRTVAFLLIAVSSVAGVAYLFSQIGLFQETTVPFSESRLMQTVSELKDTSYRYWTFHFGGVFLLGNIALLFLIIQRCKQAATILVFPLALFLLTIFPREYLDNFLGESPGYVLFLISLVLIPVVGLSIAWLKKESIVNEQSHVAIVMWFLIWTGLSRGAERYSFFVAFPLAFFIAELVELIFGRTSEKIASCFCCRDSTGTTSSSIQGILQLLSDRYPTVISSFLKGGTAVIVLAGLLFWAPMGKHANRIVAAAAETRRPFPGHGEMTDALEWMKTTLGKQGSVVAASWEDGSVLNVLGGVKTIIDQDHFIPYWIHLYCRHVFCAQSEQETLSFLKTHDVTHLILIESDLLEKTGTYSYVASRDTLDRFGDIVKMERRDPVDTRYRMAPSLPRTPLAWIDIDFDPHKLSETLAVRATLKSSDKAEPHIPYIAFVGKKRFETDIEEASEQTGGILLYFGTDGHLSSCYYVSPTGWNFLAVKLFFGRVASPHFVPVYPQEGFDTAKVKIWQIHYPPDIKKNQHYLETLPSTGTRQ